MKYSKKERRNLAYIAGSKTGKLKKTHLARIKGFLRHKHDNPTMHSLTSNELESLGVRLKEENNKQTGVI